MDTTTIDLYSDSTISIIQRITFPKVKKVHVYDSNDVYVGKVRYGTYPSTSTYLTVNDSRRLYGRGELEMDLVDDYTDSITQQWFRYEDKNEESSGYFIELKYTRIKGGPVDTLNYSSNKKEGKWEFVSSVGFFTISNFENNVQTGLETVYQKNKLKIENYYEDGVIMDVKVYDLKRRYYLEEH